MIGRIKTAIQNKLYEKCIKEYQDELRCQTDPYLVWIRENESTNGESVEDESYPSLGVVYMEQCGGDFSLTDVEKEYIIFASKNGRISARAFRKFTEYFDKHQDINVVYADEDVWMLPEELDADRNRLVQKEGDDDEMVHRIFPWTKPVWSPDTLFSFFYFGNIFAVRKSAVKNLIWLGDADYKKNIYDFVLKATEEAAKLESSVGHIGEILFHAYETGKNRKEIEEALMHRTNFIGVGAGYDAVREEALTRRGLDGRMLMDKKTGISYPVYEVSGTALVSIIIPSKDNQEVLKQCICSIYHHTDYKNFEIIVVDNGSAPQVRTELEAFKKEYVFTYIYQPMAFNFSKMCNLGVENAGGEYILLLNDDMEVIEETWLTRLVGQASLKHVGAVGAKLLYPDSTLIQHAGISSTIYGPGHKLKQMEDGVSYYYGRNRFIYDMAGVTAACLLMRKELYCTIGGLYEGLEVAYNDVDLCFRLCEKGYYNVQRNDVVLYHHESLSRGDDLQDEKKLERLMREKDELYRRHQKFYKQDPFIGTLMNSGEPEYYCRWLEGYELVNTAGFVKELREGKPLPDEKTMNQAIMVTVEDCGRECHTQKPYYLIKGWAYVPGADNARYQFKILFRNSRGQIWELPVQKRYRKDVASILPDEVNVELTGFCNWIFDDALPADAYELWMTAKDGCSRQRLYRNMEQQLVVEKQHSGGRDGL